MADPLSGLRPRHIFRLRRIGRTEGAPPEEVDLSDDHAFVERVSGHTFAQTLTRLEEAIARAALTIFARIDHASAARDVGLSMPRTTVLLYGNARGGTPIMLASPRAAIDLPLRVLVREDGDGRVLIGFRPIIAMLREVGVPYDAAARLAPAQAILVAWLEP